MGIPTITMAPTNIALQQYQKMGKIGFTSAPRLAFGTAGVYALLAYTGTSKQSQVNALTMEL